jgi:iron complex outermembrane recepter protein
LPDSIWPMIFIRIILLVLWTAAFIPVHGFASDSFDDLTSRIVTGTILDAETGEPVPFVYIHIEEINRTTTSGRDGTFEIRNVPAGRYTLIVHRIGYASRSISFIVNEAGETDPLIISMRATVLEGRPVEVVAQSNGMRGANLEHASIKLTGSALRSNLGATLSETLSSQAGFDQRTMGGAPARPVIRGMGDERLLILQDGERTGDASGASADHSVTIDPVSADEIEIARGPAALAYGSNAIGGVINVVRNQIATSVPSRLTGTATLHGSSVNSSFSGAGLLSMPLKDFVLNVDLNARYGSDFRAPSGKIDNSGFLTSSSSAGLSYIRPWGYSGIAVSSYLSNYGIPPDPLGGHPNGVDIEMRKFQVESRNEFLIEDNFFKLLEAKLSYRYYNHKEFETSSIVGTEYTFNTTNASLTARHRGYWFMDEGIIGVWGEFVDFFVFDRFNIETYNASGSVFTIQEVNIGQLHMEYGVRLDVNSAIPKEDNPGSRIGNIRQRNFIGLASSAALVYDLGLGFFAGTTFMHSFRPPTSNELYSEGPHIAAYSFEIGNPELKPERGLGKEIFLRYKSADATLELNAYHNEFQNYIYPRNTGRENIFFPRLNDYQFEGVKAQIYGIEAQGEVHFLRYFVANASFSHTIGRRDITDDERDIEGVTRKRDYLPMIPPFQINAGLNYVYNGFSVGGMVRHSTKQDRVAILEEPTNEYTIVNLNAGYRFTSKRNLLNTFSLRVNNLFNTEYRNHLSRIKEIYPEPGINVNLLYRLYF